MSEREKLRKALGNRAQVYWITQHPTVDDWGLELWCVGKDAVIIQDKREYGIDVFSRMTDEQIELMIFRARRNKELSEDCQFDIPRWKDLEVYDGKD
ncbi:MAG: hypothetical protein GY937_20065 [bacterium]|nr:hypothetical protein [bacterium]